MDALTLTSALAPPAADEAVLSRLRAVMPAIASRAAALDSMDSALPEADVAALAEAGLLTAPLPRALGGRGWGSEPAGAESVFEALRLVGRASLPLGRLYEGHVNAIRLVAEHGTPAQHAAAAAAARDGRLFGVWNTERPGIDLRIDAEGVLRGGKVLCSGAGLVERALVTGRHGGEGPQQMLLVPLERGTDRAESSEWRVTGMRASATGTVMMDGIPATEEIVLGEPDAYMRQPGFSGGAWRFLAVHLGGVEAVAAALREHHIRTGRGADPHQAARFGAVLTAAETARLWVLNAARMVEEEVAEPARIIAYVDLARGAVERAALDVLELAQRSIGLQAFTRANPVERMMRDLATYLRQPAPDRALVAGAAAGLAFGEAVGDMWP
ncbi:acyl-CoA/acyl-ACP dehydrogenase [Roseomonas sp. SG15]|uniref:Acyl-CoA/acyl-ACP dehydrogenase n=2 Tax=Roseomonas indoligenes TaxID=2820811 RepID=A0A940SA07_9PROT|nr:acyl-CoA/acyl-ACP dehydrogenase [Pararoseomonas indoligenes]